MVRQTSSIHGLSYLRALGLLLAYARVRAGLMGSPNRRHRLERDFMFAPRRIGSELALRLLDLASDRDPKIQDRLGAWLKEVLSLLPNVRMGDPTLDAMPFDSVLMALMAQRGWRGPIDPLNATIWIKVEDFVRRFPDEVEMKVREALRQMFQASADDGPA